MEKERKLQIIRAAAKRFARHGMGKTTLDEIARDIRISKASIYHYFTSKDELFNETLIWEVSQYLSDIKAIFNNEEFPVGARMLEYFSFKEGADQKYILIYKLIVQSLIPENLEDTQTILNKLFDDEEEIIRLILSSVYSGRIESMNNSLPGFIVTISWGMSLGNNLNKIARPEKILSSKELIFKSLESIMS
ncbi:MAG TPA: TetR/AcrR family transcriptional regulator [Ignavibacteriaceae bacterium]|nr:TetR/AcrR family transcriptional regulator [Ignavibacteriaceae bacterium]